MKIFPQFVKIGLPIESKKVTVLEENIPLQ